MVLQEKETHVFLAKISEQAERYDEMKDNMKKVACANSDAELTVEERNLLSVAYKNAVGSRRASWRIVSNTEQKEVSKGNTESAALAKDYRLTVEEELRKICEEILGILQTHLIDKSSSGESKVFYYKMQGDYYRYIAEFSAEKQKTESADLAKEAYTNAMDVAQRELAVTHPIRLGLALNFSVFHYEVLNNPDKACQMARAAFEQAIMEIDDVSDDSYKDSTLIMQLLRDNLTLWTSDQEVDGDENN